MGNKSFDPNSPPSAEELAKACQLMVKDEQGREVSLGEVLDAGTTATAGGKATGGAGGQPKTIAIWIRHFVRPLPGPGAGLGEGGSLGG